MPNAPMFERPSGGDFGRDVADALQIVAIDHDHHEAEQRHEVLPSIARWVLLPSPGQHGTYDRREDKAQRALVESAFELVRATQTPGRDQSRPVEVSATFFANAAAA